MSFRTAQIDEFICGLAAIRQLNLYLNLYLTRILDEHGFQDHIRLTHLFSQESGTSRPGPALPFALPRTQITRRTRRHVGRTGSRAAAGTVASVSDFFFPAVPLATCSQFQVAKSVAWSPGGEERTYRSKNKRTLNDPKDMQPYVTHFLQLRMLPTCLSPRFLHFGQRGESKTNGRSLQLSACGRVHAMRSMSETGSPCGFAWSELYAY